MIEYTCRDRISKKNNDCKYSSDEQDIIAYELLGDGKYFVDVGAGNGIHGSNTFLLEKKYGWNGICIEAHPNHVWMLEQTRNCICHEGVVAAKRDTADFRYETLRVEQHLEPKPLRHAYGGGSGLVETQNNHPTEKIENWEVRTVETVPLNDILNRYNAPEQIDFLDIDVEGAEIEILQGIDWKKYSFRLINIEIGSELIFDFLREKGYAKWRTVGTLDTMFKPR